MLLRNLSLAGLVSGVMVVVAACSSRTSHSEGVNAGGSSADDGGVSGDAGEEAGGSSSVGGTSSSGGSKGGGASNSGGTSNSGGEAGSGGSGGDGGPTSCYTAVVTSTTHSCALRNDGTVWCWGGNEKGQLGLGTTGLPHPEPVTVAGIAGVTELGSKGGMLIDPADHTCALEGDGDVFCWGAGSYGQIGDGSRDASVPPKKIVLGATDIAVGNAHSCALYEDGSVQCWGRAPAAGPPNYPCEGSQSANCLPNPWPIEGITGMADFISAGEYTTCVGVSESGQCWGSGALGYDGDTNAHTSAVVANLFGMGIAEIELGTNHSCVRKTDGNVWCLGGNALGTLGLGNTNSAPTSQRLTAFDADVADLGVGAMVSCAAKTDGTLLCWGRNDYGQAGPDSGETCSDVSCTTTPTAVPGIGGVVQVSPGVDHTCAVRSNGSVWCFGRNNQGQLGDGSYTNSSTPVEVVLPCPEGCHPSSGHCPSLTLQQCNAEPGCTWDVGTCGGEPTLCGESCSIYGCSGCVGQPFACDFFNGTACDEVEGCTWDDGACAGTVLGCPSYMNQNDCVRHAGCQWVGYCTGFQYECPSYGKQFCKDQGCDWIDSGCYGLPTSCTGLGETACNEAPGCAWY